MDTEWTPSGQRSPVTVLTPEGPLLFHNALETLPYEFGRLFQLRTLGLHGNPLCEAVSRHADSTASVLQFLLDKAPGALLWREESLGARVPPSHVLFGCSAAAATGAAVADAGRGEPNRRATCGAAAAREALRPRTHMASLTPAASLSVICYNVLCDKYATRQLYGYCPAWALDWDYRKHYILKHILDSGADVAALQEVETREFTGFFLAELRKHGYEGMFQPKTRAERFSGEDRLSVDGCAVLWKTSSCVGACAALAVLR